jgi:hypothetical protein
VSEAALPAPLTPPDCDLRGLPRLPLDVAQLRDGAMTLLPDAEPFRAGLLALAAAWWQVPAASLPDDETALAYLCGYGRDIGTWQRVCGAGALAEWVRCSDGRLYHPALAERACDAWAQRQVYRQRSRRANDARWGTKDRARSPDAVQQASDKDATTIAVASLDASLSAPKGEGEREVVYSVRRTDAPAAAVTSLPDRVHPFDPRKAVWTEGVTILCRLTGKPEGSARKLIGALLKTAKDDCTGMLAALRECPDGGDPIAWLSAAAKQRGGSRANATEEMRHAWSLGNGVIDASFMDDEAPEQRRLLA